MECPLGNAKGWSEGCEIAGGEASACQDPCVPGIEVIRKPN